MEILKIILFIITIVIDIFILIQVIREIITGIKYEERFFIKIIKASPFLLIVLLPIIDILFFISYYSEKNKEKKIQHKKEYEMSTIEKYNVLVKTLIDCGYFKNHNEVIKFIENGKIMDTLTKDYSQNNNF